MNNYIAKFEKYFGGYASFNILAENKGDAKRYAMEKGKRNDNLNLNTLKIKKVQKFK